MKWRRTGWQVEMERKPPKPLLKKLGKKEEQRCCSIGKDLLVTVSWGPSFIIYFSSFLASGYFIHPLITFGNSSDPDQALQNVWHSLTLWWYSWKIFWKRYFKKKNLNNKKHAKLPSMQRVNEFRSKNVSMNLYPSKREHTQLKVVVFLI